MAEPMSAPTPEATQITAPVEPIPQAAETKQPLRTNSQLKLSVGAPKKRDFSTVPFWLGSGLSVAWIVMVATALVAAGEGSRSFAGIPLVNWAIGMSAIASPVALIWMITAYLQRASDVQVMTEPLRRQLNLIIGENSVAENRIRRFNAALREQIELLRQGSKVGEEEIINLLEQLAWEREEVKKIAAQKLSQVHEAGKITHAAEMFDSILTNKLKLVQEIEEKLSHSGGQISENSDKLRALLNEVLAEIKDGNHSLSNALSTVKEDSKELRDHLRGQEVDILNAQNNMKTLLSQSEQEFDAILGRFYDRTKDVESAFDDASATLEERIAMLERAGSILPAKIAAAAEQLNAAIGNYQTIEQTAQSTSSNTTRILNEQTQAIAQALDGFSTKLTTNDAEFNEQRQALAAMLDRITLATGDVQYALKAGTSDLEQATETSLVRFQAVAAQVKAEARGLTEQLVSATQHYESAAAKATEKSAAHRTQLEMTQDQLRQDIATLAEADSQSEAHALAMQARSSSTLLAVQEMEGKLRSLYNALSEASSQAQQNLFKQTEAQRALIQQLGEAAENSVTTLQRATQNMDGQHDKLLTRATQSEAQLQKLVQELMHLHDNSNQRQDQQLKLMQNGLRDTADLLRAAELQLQDFNLRALEPVTLAASRISEATAQSGAQLDKFSSKLETQTAQITQFNDKVTQASDALEGSATRSSGIISSLLTSLLNLGKQQEEVAQQVTRHVDQGSDKLAGVLRDLDQQAAQVGTRLQQASTQLSDQETALVATTAAAEAALQKRLQEVGELHSAQATRYDQQVAQFNDGLRSTQDMLNTTEQKLQQFSERAIAPINQAAERIVAAAAESGNSISAFANKLDQQVDHLAQFEARVKQAGSTLEATTEKSNISLGSMLSNLLNLGQKQESLVLQTEAGFDRAGNKLSNLTNQTAQAVEKIEQAGDKFAAQQETLLAQTEMAENTLQERLQAINTLHHQNTQHYADQLAQVNAGLNQTTDALQITEQRLQQFQTNGLAPINLATQQLNEAAEQSRVKMTAFTQSLEMQAQEVSSFEGRIESVHGTLENAAAKTSIVIGTLLSNLFNLGQKQDEATQKTTQNFAIVADKMAATLQTLEHNADTVATRVVQASDLITAQSQTLVTHTAEVEQELQLRLQNLNNMHSTQVQNFALFNQELRETTGNINMVQQRLQDFGQQALEPINVATHRINDAAEQGSARMTAFSQTLENQAQQIVSLESRLQETHGVMEATASKSSSLISTLLTNLFNLGQKQDETTEKTAQNLTLITDKLATTLQTLENNAGTVATRVVQASDLIAVQSQTLVTHTAEVEQELQLRLQNLNNMHSTQVQNFVQVDQALRETAGTIHLVEQRLQSFSTQALEPINVATHRISDAAEQGSARMTAFSQTLENQALQIVSLESRLQETHGVMEATANKSSSLIGTLITNLFNLGQKQDELAQKVEGDFDRVGMKLGRTLDTIAGQTINTVTQLEQAHDTLDARHRTLVAYTAETEATLQARAEQITLIHSEQNLRYAQHVAALNQGLQITTDQLTQTEQKLLQFNEQAVIPVKLAAERIAETTTASSTHLAAFANTLATQSGALTEFAAKANEASTTLEAATTRSNTSIGSFIANLLNLGQKQDELAQKVDHKITHVTSKLEDALQSLDHNADTVATRLVIASDKLDTQSQTLLSHTTEAEAQLQQQLRAINALHSENTQHYAQHLAQVDQAVRSTTETLQAAEQRMQSFSTQSLEPMEQAASRMNVAAEQGSARITAFTQSLDQHAAQITQLHDRLAQANHESDTATTRNTTAITTMLADMLNLGREQDTLAQKIAAHFDNATAKLTGEMSSLSGQATQTVETIELARQRLHTQHDVLTERATASAQAMQLASTTMESRATNMHDALQRQLGGIAQELATLETRFAATGDMVQQKADAAYVLMDQAGNRFSELTLDLSGKVTDQTSLLQTMVSQSLQHVGNLGDVLEDRLRQIGLGNAGLQEVAGQIATANDRIIAQLSRLHSESAQASRVAQDTAAFSIAQMTSAGSTLEQQQQVLRTIADHVIDDMTRTSGSLEAQTLRLNQLGQTQDTQIHLLQDSLAELEGRSLSLRDAMSQHSATLVGQLQQGVSQLQDMGNQLQVSVTNALHGADQVHGRFDSLTQQGAQQLQERLAQMQGMSGVVEQALDSMRNGMQQQLAALNGAVQEITQQQGLLQNATAAQREELLTLFDRLAQAHQSSAIAAEQTIASFANVTAQVSQSLLGFSTEATNSLQQVQQAGSGFAAETQEIILQSHEAAQQVRAIMSVTETLADHARTLSAQTQSEAGRLASDVAAIIDNMDGNSVRLQEQTSSLLRNIGASSAAVTVQIADAVTNLQQCGDQVRDQMTMQAAALRDQAQNEADHLVSRVEQLMTRLDHSGSTMQSRARDILGDIEQSGDSLLQQISGLLDAITDNNAAIRAQMSQQARETREQAYHEANQMAEAFGEVLRDIDKSGDRLRDQAESILHRITESRSGIEASLTDALQHFGDGSTAMRDQILGHVALLREKALQEAATLGDSLNTLVGQIDHAGDRLQSQARTIMDNVSLTRSAIDDQVGASLIQLTDSSATIREQMATQIQALRDNALTEAQHFGDQLALMLSQIEQGGGNLREQTQDILHTIGQSRAQIIDQFSTLLEQIESKNHVVRDQIARHAATLHTKADAEAERFSTSLTHLLGQIDGSIGHLRFQSEDVLARIMQGGTQAKQEFAHILSHIAGNQQQIQDELSNYATALRQQAMQDMAKISGDITEMLERIDGSGDRMRQHVREAVGTIDLGGDALAQQVEVLLERIGENHHHIRSQMTEQATQIRDEYAGEVARMADGLRQMMSQLQQVGVHLHAQNNDVLNNLDQSALRFSQSATQAAQALFTQVDQLDEAADRVGSRLQSLGATLQEEQSALIAASDNINAHTVQMAAQTAAAAEQMHDLLAVVSASSQQTQGLSSHVASQLQGMIIHLREEMQRLSEHSASTAQAAAQVVEQVIASTDGLLTAGAQIRQEGAQLPQIIDMAEERMTRAGALLRDHAADAVGMLESTAGRFVQVFEQPQNEVALQTQRLQDVATQAGNLLRQFGHELVEQLSNLQSGAGIVEVTQQKLVDQTAAAIAHMAVASDRLNNLREGAETAHSQMLGKLQYMDSQAQATTKVLTVGSQALTQNINQLAEVSTKAQNEMMGVGAHYRAQLEELRLGLQHELAGLHEGVGTAAQMLEQKSAGLRQATNTALRDIEHIIEDFNHATDRNGATIIGKTEALRNMAEDVAQLLLGFGKTVDAQLTHLSSASETIGTTQQYLSGTLDNSIRQVDILRDKMEGSRALAQSSTEQVGVQLQKLSNSLQQHIEQLGTDTQRAVGLVDTAGQSWQDQAQNLARVAQQARSELAAISYAIDALQQKGETMRDNIRGQGQSLIESLSGVIDQMEATSDDGLSNDPLVNRIERGLKKIS